MSRYSLEGDSLLVDVASFAKTRQTVISRGKTQADEWV
jgi:hypothetical protein